MKRLRAACVVFFVMAHPFNLFSQTDSTLLTLDNIFNSDIFELEKPKPIRFLEDDKSYTVLEPSEAIQGERDLVQYNAETDEREILISATELVPPHDSTALSIDDYKLCPQSRIVLIFTNTKKVWRLNTRGDYWILDRKNKSLRQLGKNLPPASLMFATFSPDFHRVAYVCENNIYIEDVASGEIDQITHDGSDTIINGTTDWVYEEEFRLRHAFRWSPDSKKIAFWQFNSEAVRDFYLINNTDSLYPTITTIPYPKAGTENSTCRIGVFSLSSQKTMWIENPKDEEFYIPYMEWVDDSQIVFQRMNRLQNKVEVTLANPATGQTKVILTDTDEAWLDLVANIEWISDNEKFIWLSEKDGWSHLYTVSRDGKMNLITPGEFDVISVQGIDRKNGWIYFIASPDNPTQRYLYRASFHGKKVERVTPKNQPGTHTYKISPNGNLAMHSFSHINMPTRYEIISLPDHHVIKILETNEKLAKQLRQIPNRNINFFKVKTQHAEMDAWEIKPHDFDVSQKYPLLLFVYGEPHNTTVKDSWGRTRDLWFQMLAQRGYVVMSIDNRGTPQPRGRDWRKIAHKQIGVISSLDQKEALDEIIKMKPYVDADCVGMWGWSGGASTTLNAMFRYPESFHVGMAVAPVAHVKYYDTIYQERYMGLPQDDPEAYDECSPLTFAENLQGKLLLVHGTGDDNVHYQATEVLINELIKHNKQFSMMSYPNRTHGIREGEGTQLHLYTLMTNFLFENLPAIENVK